MKKILSIALVVVLLAGIAVSGTMAYLTDTDSAVNVMTLGNVKIKQNEEQRVDPSKNGTLSEADIEDFKQAKPLYPYVDENLNHKMGDDYEEITFPNGNTHKLFIGDNAIDKLVSVTNTGKTEAYVRTIIALEAPTDNIDLAFNSTDWKMDKEASSYSIEVDGVKYDLFVCVYKEVLKPDETTPYSLLQIALDYKATNEDSAAYGDTYDVLVLSQAVQTAGFENAQIALDTAFGAVDAATAAEWFGGMNASTLVSTAEELKTAIENAEDGDTIILTDDIEGDITVGQAPDVDFTIDGNGKDYDGVIVVDGKSKTYTTAGITIKNINFNADSISADACIRLGDGTNATRYTCNVTIENCTFDVPGAVGVKSYTGGDKNVTITGCTATANAHSLCQLKGVDGVLVENCEVYSKNGLNFNNSDNVTVSGCTVDVKGYAVRFGESSGGVGAAETYRIENCTLKSANDGGDATIILRGTADNSTLTIVNTTITGSPDIANTASGATVVR